MVGMLASMVVQRWQQASSGRSRLSRVEEQVHNANEAYNCKLELDLEGRAGTMGRV